MDSSTPKRDANAEQPQPAPWRSDPDTVERRDGERRDSGGDADESSADTTTPADGKEPA
jgi:hypothetical protein